MSLPNRRRVADAIARLDPVEVAGRRWFAAKGAPSTPLALAHAFALPGVDPAVVLALVDVPAPAGQDRYLLPLVPDGGGGYREAAEGDGVWRALAAAIAGGATIAALPSGTGVDDTPFVPAGRTASTAAGSPLQGARGARASSNGPGPVEAALVCRPSPGLSRLWPGRPSDVANAAERPLGRDQSNTSCVIGDRLLLKAFRRMWPGLNPDLELTAYLSEEAGFPGVARLAGWAEIVSRDAGIATVAMLQEFVPGADDLYETLAERLAGWILAPGTVSLEWATEVADDLGRLVGGLHAVLAGPPSEAAGFVPRPATREEVRRWHDEAVARLREAVRTVGSVDRGVGVELREASPAILARLSRFEALAAAPLVMRIHADLHLGQVLLAEDGYRIVDFEGDPLRPIEDRRRADSPLRDVASMLRSLDHAARSAGRRAERRAGGRIGSPGLDPEAWIERARVRFLDAYAETVRRAGSPIPVDVDLVEAFEVAKETSEFIYAATVRPGWLWAPRDGMRWLLREAAAG